MSDRSIILADSYLAPWRPLFLIELVEHGTLEPFNLTGLTIETTFVEETDDETIPRENALIHATLVIDDDGNVVGDTDGLRLAGPVSDGLIYHELTATQTAALPVRTPLVSDVRTKRLDLVTDQEHITTFMMSGTLEGRYGITNRLEAAP